MDREQFEVLHQAHVMEWERLAETGDIIKSSHICDNYKNGCPACELALLTRFAVGDLEREGGDHRFQSADCHYCPITVWRELAIEFDTPIGDAECVDGLFGDWDFLSSGLLGHGGVASDEELDQLRNLAQQIANLKWSWIPEYENVEVVGE